MCAAILLPTLFSWGVSAPALGNQAPDAKSLITRAAKHIEKKEWSAAIAGLESAIKLTPEDHWPAYQLGAALHYAGERGRYDAICRDMLKRFADNPRVEIGDRVAKLCFMTDKVVDDSKIPFALVDRALADDKNKSLQPYFQLTKGLAEYRAGNAKAAIEVIDKILPKFRGDNVFHAQAKSILAMSCKKLGRDDEARKHLADAVRILDTLESRRRLLNTASWHDPLFALILRQEAEKVIGN